jgi:hypothetical protein
MENPKSEILTASSFKIKNDISFFFISKPDG